MTGVEYGPLRQLWLAPVEDSTNESSFLVRDDAYSRASATLGRTLRLGDPVDTGPVSAEYQTDWAGGRGQRVYSDKSMFLDSDLDTTDPSGKVRPWMGYKVITGGVTTGESVTAMLPQKKGVVAADVLLLAAIKNGANGYVQSMKYDGSFMATLKSFTGEYPTCISELEQSGAYSGDFNVVGTSAGNLWTVSSISGTWVDISTPTVGDKAFISAVVPFQQKLMLNMGNALWTRDWNGTTAIWTKVRNFNSTEVIRKIAVLGDTAYVMTDAPGTRVNVYVTNGTTTSLLYRFENCLASDLLVHFGSLYATVREFAYDSSGAWQPRIALYVYNGSTMRKVVDRDDFTEWSATGNNDGPACVWGDYIAMAYQQAPTLLGAPGGASQRSWGVMLYDPANDSLHMGPSISGLPSSTEQQALCQWNGSLVWGVSSASLKWAVFATRRDRGIAHAGFSGTTYTSVSTTAFKRTLVSSSFDAGLPTVDKAWLGVDMKHNYAYPKGLSWRVYVRLAGTTYDTANWIEVGNTGVLFGSSPGTTFETSQYNIKDALSKLYPLASSLEYCVVVELEADTTATVDDFQIDSVAVRYMVTPSKKKVWRLRVVCEDAQPRLDGTSNPLNTREGLVGRLFSLWAAGRPLYMWDATTGTTTPTDTTASNVVMISDIVETGYRVDSVSKETVSEVAITAYEVAEPVAGEGVFWLPF